MKNLIYYYYGLQVSTIKQNNDVFTFYIDDSIFEFIPYNENIEKLDEIYRLLMQNKKQYHKIIINKFNSIVTYNKDKPYVLILLDKTLNNKITFNDIYNYSTSLNYKNKINWKKLWEKKVDYYEYQMAEIGIKYENLVNSFNYYVGLSENAISLLNEVKNYEFEVGFCHKRVSVNDQFYNPTNIIIDSRVRDYAEYFKIAFFNNELDPNEIMNIISRIYFKESEAILFISRMLYPSYYFDIYDKVIKEEISEEKINKYIKKSTQYEMLLKNIYKYLNINYKIPIIEWLNIN